MLNWSASASRRVLKDRTLLVRLNEKGLTTHFRWLLKVHKRQHCRCDIGQAAVF